MDAVGTLRRPPEVSQWKSVGSFDIVITVAIIIITNADPAWPLRRQLVHLKHPDKGQWAPLSSSSLSSSSAPPPPAQKSTVHLARHVPTATYWECFDEGQRTSLTSLCRYIHRHHRYHLVHFVSFLSCVQTVSISCCCPHSVFLYVQRFFIPCCCPHFFFCVSSHSLCVCGGGGGGVTVLIYFCVLSRIIVAVRISFSACPDVQTVLISCHCPHLFAMYVRQFPFLTAVQRKKNNSLCSCVLNARFTLFAFSVSRCCLHFLFCVQTFGTPHFNKTKQNKTLNLKQE